MGLFIQYPIGLHVFQLNLRYQVMIPAYISSFDHYELKANCIYNRMLNQFSASNWLFSVSSGRQSITLFKNLPDDERDFQRNYHVSCIFKQGYEEFTSLIYYLTSK
ncbi:unnamed protein product [Meloidogyne enterolobii]|uniref:Uncharacterized protein n=1 Tax=Meloidogyne enterolobii TaxID=390850 RepID=A0ACB1A8C9_MELEN